MDNGLGYMSIEYKIKQFVPVSQPCNFCTYSTILKNQQVQVFWIAPVSGFYDFRTLTKEPRPVQLWHFNLLRKLQPTDISSS